MRRRGLWLSSRIAAAVMVLVMLSGCEGPQGTQGPQGPPGPAGPEGPQGPAGQDANQNCVQCHVDDTELFARQVQYWSSTHANGGNFERASSTYSLATSCAPCHAHEGFMEFSRRASTPRRRASRIRRRSTAAPVTAST